MHRGEWAPIALFIYKRPNHTRRAIEALRSCRGFEHSPVFVFADGPRSDGDRDLVAETRTVARELLGRDAVFHESDRNEGLDTKEIAAVRKLCSQFGRAIAIEDDLVVAPGFLEFLNAGLRRYEHEDRVMQICGYMFDVPELRDSRTALFLPMTSAWGWATWERAWRLFDEQANGWAERLADPAERWRFNLNGRFDYARMLSNEMKKETAAWDIRWYYTAFVRNGLGLFPPQTLVLNEGYDGTGTHVRLALRPRQGSLSDAAEVAFPSAVHVSPHAEAVFRAIGTYRQASFGRKLRAAVRAWLAGSWR